MPAASLQSIVALLIVSSAIAASIAVWSVAIERWRQGLSVVRYEPRRLAPWGGGHLLAIVAFYGLLLSLAGLLAQQWLGLEATRPPAVRSAEHSGAEHVVAKLLTEMNIWTLAVTVASAVLVAPIVEELFFRVLLQGWLEKVEVRLRPRMPTLRRWVPRAAGPIFLTAFLFGRMHFRVDEPAVRLQYMIYMVAADTVVKVLSLVFAVVLLRRHVGATAADFGWAPKKLLPDLGLALAAFVAIVPPLYLLQFALGQFLPEYLAPDPFVLLLLALALGTLYYRTHRIAPLVAVHAALNAISWGLLVVFRLLGG